jgi:hypothetical protein
VAALLAVGVVGSRVATADPVDLTTGGAEEEFVVPVGGALEELAPVAAASAAETPSSGAVVGTLPPNLPRRVTVVGDSQATALMRNAPKGIGSTLDLDDGALDGCGLYDEGSIHTTANFRRVFGNCEGWPDEWAEAAAEGQAQITLVVLGAWDVFDLDRDDGLLRFATPEYDAYVTTQLQRGVDALVGAGSKVALLEVPCYEPVDGGGLVALPERGDEARTSHLNELFRQVAAANPATVTFISGPTEWCDDPAIATDLGYRWDGVHYYRPGAKLVFETIAPQLLAIQV